MHAGRIISRNSLDIHAVLAGFGLAGF